MRIFLGHMRGAQTLVQAKSICCWGWKTACAWDQCWYAQERRCCWVHICSFACPEKGGIPAGTWSGGMGRPAAVRMTQLVFTTLPSQGGQVLYLAMFSYKDEKCGRKSGGIHFLNDTPQFSTRQTSPWTSHPAPFSIVNNIPQRPRLYCPLLFDLRARYFLRGSEGGR